MDEEEERSIEIQKQVEEVVGKEKVKMERREEELKAEEKVKLEKARKKLEEVRGGSKKGGRQR